MIRKWECVVYAPGGPFRHPAFTRLGAEFFMFMVNMPMGPRYLGIEWIEVRRRTPTGEDGR